MYKLEDIVAEALRSLGFSVQTNVRLPAKGGDIEVNVWATRNVGSTQLRVYVSCKNWDKDVDRTIIDHELGRVLQLHPLLYLRILVVKSLTEPARKVAFDNGFFVIELGEKATAENAQEIYSIVYNKLKEIFIGIAPEKDNEGC
ncbi:MAG: restriction endonuclease [Desulfurococcaceae archaeon]|nr:restriction endonuclease [Desulfurococcaceae archaeon]